MFSIGSGKRWLGIIASAAVLFSLFAVNPLGAQDEVPEPFWLANEPIPEGAPHSILEIGANGRVTATGPLGRVYGEAGDGFALIAGGDLLDVCTSPYPREREMRIYRQGDGFVVRLGAAGQDMPMFLYETDLGVFELFDSACGGFFENGTPIPHAVASGVGTMKLFERPSELPWVVAGGPPPVGSYRNSVEGTLLDADGGTYEVDAAARFTVEEEGGDPIFEILELNVTPPAG